MAERSRAAAQVWSDPRFAAAWLAADPEGGQDLLVLPRLIAAELVAEEGPQPRLIVDVAGGAGKFLAVLLDRFPEAAGVWLDASPTMLDQARTELARFGGRVEFRPGDMTALRAAGVPGGADVIATSRASHHLDRAELHGFYREAAGLLAPGGWLVNLDHIASEPAWDRRLRSVRRAFVPPRPAATAHHHDRPLPGIEDHLDGYRAAGVDDVDIAWKAFHTCLFAGRTDPAAPAGG
ncbi:Methyltransferase domain-containing protein [Actinacidiphila yanglinensis]|uniref:Methyltransferase domain-containing protein n=1 Tax=Actinacidiphila yanglinensis TaxID=310779 RepID=A0A1H6DY71_9ACTN|nr:class I SAM-dependent methyltransferase [Actinacidiphila yanglinensis]SEG89555.1 Methyltransferase domain-containing protein [Actinacidiphila yanglinensis]